MKANITKELIFDNFANKVTPLQRRQIDHWLQTESNEELYYKWLEEWENHHLEYQPDSELLVISYLNHIRTTPLQGTLGEPIRNRLSRISVAWTAPVAAAAAIFLVTMVLWLYKSTISYRTYQTTNGETKALVLEDGSQVTLNPRSSLMVPRWKFGTSSREVILDGEANFSITHTSDNRKFIVKTKKDFEVVVLGTEFSVLSRTRGARVVLNKGKVQVNYQEGRTIRQLVMKPGERVSFDKQNQPTLSQSSRFSDSSLWHEKRFVFDETKLVDVAQMLEETYGLKVEIGSPRLAQRELMGSFRANNLDELLQTISDLLDINIVREEDTVRLSEK